MNKPYQVVMDTSVLVAGLRSRRGASFRLLELLGDSRWQIHLSTALVLEYEAVARREAAQLWAQPERVEAILDYICAVGMAHRIFFSWRPCLPDPEDDFVLELAVAASAAWIITHNVRDFRGAERFGVRAITPREFLNLLEEKS